MLKKLFGIFLISIIVFSIIPSVQSKEDNNVLADPDSEKTQSAKIVASPAAQPIQWNKIDKEIKYNLGSTTQQYTTDLFTGSASYAYQIEVPPGVNALEPSLTISYNHHNALSPLSLLGNGWTITSNFIYRDVNYTIPNTRDDVFKIVLNGISSELVYVPSESRYHTKHESYLLIEKKSGGPNAKKEYWLVRDKDGTTYRFGHTIDAELVSNQENYVSQWHLDSVKDIYGNEILYTYENDASSGVVYPKGISYSNGVNKIRFNYVPNPNQREVYSNGNFIKQSKILKSIRVENNDALVRQYEFDYSQSETQNLLTRIQETGSDGNSKLLPIIFRYNEPQPGWVQDTSYTIPYEAYFGQELDEGVRLFDINGDGLVDISKMLGSNDLTYWLNIKDGWGEKQMMNGVINGGFVDASYSDEGVRFIDMNGDLRVDIIKLVSHASSQTKELKINNGNGFISKSVNLPPEIDFISKGIGNCNPVSCNPGWSDLGVECGEGICSRTCSQQPLTCGNWRKVFESEGEGYDRTDSTESDSTRKYKTSSNSRCYAFIVDTPNELELDVNEDECINDKKYDGKTVIIAGLEGEGENSWLETVPPKTEQERWYGNLNDYPGADFINSYITSHEDNEDSFENSDIRNFARDDEILYCAPSAEICENSGLNLCGYGCYEQGTRAFVQSGYYRDKGDWFETIAEDKECDDDNVYDHEADFIRLEVQEGDLIPGQTIYEQYLCPKFPYIIDVGVRMVDVNGDGKTDILKSTSEERKVWINTGNGFALSNQWAIPTDALFLNPNNGGDNGVRLADVNGDGLIDLVKGNSENIKTWINTGKVWVQKNSWNVPVDAIFVNEYSEPTGVVLEDVNGDGLNDLIKSKTGGQKKVWINNGRGWVENRAWRLPLDADFAKVNTQFADVNGDGAMDVVKGDPTDRRTWLNKASKPYLLNEIRNGRGGKIFIDYKPVSSIDNTGIDQIADLPIPAWIVSSITLDNGMPEAHHISSVYNYDYRDGMFDAASREFRGFKTVTEFLSDGTKIDHHFFQDDALKGLEYETGISNDDSAYEKTEKTFDSLLIDGFYIIALSSVKETQFGDDETILIQTDFNYDEFGNVVNVLSKGNTETKDDDRSWRVEYTYNRNLWIVNTPKHIISFDEEGRKATESWLSYDGLAYDRSPTKGDVTREEYWLDTGEDVFTIYVYDRYGNLVAEEDSLKRVNSYRYDPTHTFITKSTNAKSHETNYEYDLKTGNLLSKTDPNGIRTRYVYDVFGRLIKEIKPYDSEQYPTLLTEYTLDGTAPERIITKQREISGQPNTYDEIYFYDGFGNLIQIKKEAENSRYAIYNIFYDELGRDKLIVNPFFDERNNEYSLVSSKPKGYTYSYDSLGRVIKVTNPDDTKREFAYSPSTTLVTDENNHQTKYKYDAYDNIVTVFEYDNDDVYETHYTYDANNNLVEIKDNELNEIRYEYDSLGRKIQLNDPDLGIWTYDYDSEGNLIEQIDNKGNEIEFVYDGLNRPVEKISPEGEIRFVYDIGKKGTLSSVSSPEITVDYGYDDRLRKIREINRISRQSFATSYEYDAMDRVTRKILPNKEVISYIYNEQGLVDSMTGNKPVLINVDYNELGFPSRKLYANALATNNEYDSDTFRLKKITTTNIQDLRYTYDNIGNIIGIVDLKNDNVRSIQYDDLDRITYVESSGDNEGLHYQMEYSYDSIGNIISVLYRGKYFLEYVYENIIHAPSKLKIQLMQNNGEVREKRITESEIIQEPEAAKKYESPDPNITENSGTGMGHPITIKESAPQNPSSRGLVVSNRKAGGASKPIAKNSIREICNNRDDNKNNEIDEGNICEPKGDFNKDRKVDFDDFFLLADNFDINITSNNWDSSYGIYDLNADGKIDYDDYAIFSDLMEKSK